MKIIQNIVLTAIIVLGITLSNVNAAKNQPTTNTGVSQWKNPICANSENNNAIEDYELTLASSGLGAGTTLTKAALEAVARCTGEGNNTCCGEVKITETTEGVIIQAYRAQALQCGSGAISTNWFPTESMWSPGGRLLAYGFCMIYCFLGIAIIADRFMVAIEVITSAEVSKTITLANGEKKTIKFLRWNETVANLTLMALGSSAPEILLAVGETVGTLGKPPQDGLGPATIVGSAAFNLLAISAICVMAIPKGEVRRIDDIGVFIITASFSLFAYVWMYICLLDNEVTVVESIITIVWMWPLIHLSYCADRGWPCIKKKGEKSTAVPTLAKIRVEGDAQYANSKYIQNASVDGAAKEERYKAAKEPLELRNKLHTMLKEEQDPSKLDPDILARDLAMRHMEEAPKSRMYYRINARRGLTGGKRLGVKRGGSKTDLMAAQKKEALLKKMHLPDVEKEAKAHHSVFEFAATHYNVFENENFVSVKVIRKGDITIDASVFYETSNGTALAGVDYDYGCGELIFKANETEKVIKINIVDDNEYEPDENFFVRIYIRDTKSKHVCAGQVITEVTIINDDEPGEISFEDGKMILSELSGLNKLKILRKNGSDGTILLKYKITPGTAVEGIDFKCAVEGTLKFEHMEMVKFLDIEVINDAKKAGKNREFDIDLEIDGFPECGVKYGMFRKTTVSIATDVKLAAAIDNVTAKLNEHLENFAVGSATWTHQFSEAITLHGEHGEEPSAVDLIFHFLSINWKVLFAFVPPTSYAGGWACFFTSLAFIGGLTVFVGDVAGTFGCLLGLSPTVTAITFVALGTSLPDTFASYEAAVDSDNADASIGNVTGSNSVNVFLGQGLPWLIGSLYYAGNADHKGTNKYFVSAGDLAFSLAVFLPCAIICIALFFVRRYKCGGELGGPVMAKRVSAFIMIFLWFLYVLMSTLQSQGIISVNI